MRYLVLIISLLFPSFGFAQNYSEIFNEWVAKNSIQNAVIVVQKNGSTVFQKGQGAFSPNDRYIMASLSKAVTGACVASLVQRGRLSFETTVGEGLKKYAARKGIKFSSSMEKVTVKQLLTHKAGVSRNARGEGQLDQVLQGGTSFFGGFSYSNAGYNILGLLVEEASGQNYQSYCRSAVFSPIGVDARLDEESWGGAAGAWVMRGSDYLKFLNTLSESGFRYGKAAKDFTFSEDGGLSNYSLGVNVRQTAKGKSIYHSGNIVWNGMQMNTYAVRFQDGTGWFIATGAGSGNLVQKLNQSLRSASGL